MARPSTSPLTPLPELKTARFQSVVQACGQPEPYTLWGNPESDRTFAVAIRAQRVLTVLRNDVGARADVGWVGYDARRPGDYLLFPRALRRFKDRRIVGIHYELVRRPELASPRPEAKTPGAAAPKTLRKRPAAESRAIALAPPVAPSSPPASRRSATNGSRTVRRTSGSQPSMDPQVERVVRAAVADL